VRPTEPLYTSEKARPFGGRAEGFINLEVSVLIGRIENRAAGQSNGAAEAIGFVGNSGRAFFPTSAGSFRAAHNAESATALRNLRPRTALSARYCSRRRLRSSAYGSRLFRCRRHGAARSLDELNLDLAGDGTL
jgi:hypothetical protein